MVRMYSKDNGVIKIYAGNVRLKRNELPIRGNRSSHQVSSWKTVEIIATKFEGAVRDREVIVNTEVSTFITPRQPRGNCNYRWVAVGFYHVGKC